MLSWNLASSCLRLFINGLQVLSVCKNLSGLRNNYLSSTREMAPCLRVLSSPEDWGSILMPTNKLNIPPMPVTPAQRNSLFWPPQMHRCAHLHTRVCTHSDAYTQTQMNKINLEDGEGRRRRRRRKNDLLVVPGMLSSFYFWFFSSFL